MTRTPEDAAARPGPAVRAYAAVDLGASSGRVVLGLVDRDTVTVHEVHRFPNVAVEQDGVLAWDVDALFEETLTGLAAAVAECARSGTRLEGIGVDSWGVDFALVDEDGVRTGPVRSHRGVEDPGPLVAARGIEEAEVYAATGVPDQAINTSVQLAAATAGGAHTGDGLLFVPDLWVQLLTGRRGTEPTIASTSQLLDPRVDRWLPELLEAHGAAGIRMPPVLELGAVAGRTTREVTTRLGLSAPVAVIRVAGHDTASAFAFARPVQRGAAVEGLVSSGTWSLVGLALAEPLTIEEALAAGFTNERGVDGVVLVRNLSGMWLLQQCLAHWSQEDGEAVALADLLAAADARPGHPHVLDVADERLLPPGDMPARIAVLCAEAGRPLDGSRAEVVRAVLDSLAAAYADALTEAAALADCTVDRVRVVGGGSRNAVLCQLTADATGRPVTAGPVEASAIGNIAVQAVVSGARPSVEAVYADLTGAGSESVTYQPRADRQHQSASCADAVVGTATRAHEPGRTREGHPRDDLPGEDPMTTTTTTTTTTTPTASSGGTPAGVIEALVRVSRTVGEPHRDLALLAEGNTSARSGPGRMLVKASGSSLRTAAPEDFVDVDLARVMRLVDSPDPVDDDGVAAAMREAAGPGGRRPSVEALLHAVCLEVPEVGAVVHTHPVVVNALLCSDRAEALVGGSLFPDQVVVLGRHNLLVPYVDPGLPLAREVLHRLRAFVAEHGTHPRVIYLRNHGMFTLGSDPDDAFAVTEMAVKSARILHGALAVGAVVPMNPSQAERIDTRPDEAFRRRRLAGTQEEQP